jgi:hypothetical protein
MIMIVKIAILAAIATLAILLNGARPADAQEAPASTAIVQPSLKPSVVLANADRVCTGTFVLSADALAMCTAKTYPRVVKDGTRFANVGIGAEFNTLIRQLKAE